MIILFTFLGLKKNVVNQSYFAYLDNSVSQSLEYDGKSGLSQSKMLLNELISKKQEAVLLTSDFSSFSNYAKTGEELLNEIALIDYTYSHPSIVSVIKKFKESDHPRAVIFNDMQGVSTDDLIVLKEDSSRNYSLIVNDLSKKGNVYVDTAYVENNESDYNSISLTLKIGTSGKFKEGSVVIKLLSNGKQVSSVVKKVEEVSMVQFDIPRSSNIRYEIMLSGDDVEFDNSFFFTLTNIDKPKVVLISNGENDYLNKVFGNLELFDFSKMDKNSIDYSIMELADLIIINNLKSIPEGIFSQLSQSTFVLFPADSVDYSASKNIFNIKRSVPKDDNLYRADFDYKNNLFLGVFDKISTKKDMPIGSAVYSFGGTFESLMILGNGQTFLAKSAEKNVYMLSCPLGEKYTNLPVHGIFLPLMYQLAKQSVRSESSTICYYPNQLVTVKSDFSEAPIKIIGSDFEIIPEFYRRKNDIVLRIPPSVAPGFYHIVQASDTVGNIAVNQVKSESIMEGLTIGELEDFFSTSRNVSIHNLDSVISSEYLLGDTPSSLWKYALILALFFILTETMLHKYLR